MSLLLANVNLDQWHKQSENPVRKASITAAVAASFFFVYPVVAGPAEDITVDKWAPAIQQPYFPPKPRQTAGDFRQEFTETLPVVEIITLDKWWQPSSQPYFTKRRHTATGEFRFETPRVVLVSDWFQPISQPYFSKLRNSKTGEFRFELPRTILLSDWFARTQEPLRKRLVSRIQGGEVRTELAIVAPETITVDKWFQPIKQPNQRRVIPFYIGETLVNITVDTPIIPPVTPPVVETPGSGGRRAEISAAEGRRRIIEEENEIILAVIYTFMQCQE